jgi:hypothetical protein
MEMLVFRVGCEIDVTVSRSLPHGSQVKVLEFRFRLAREIVCSTPFNN